MRSGERRLLDRARMLAAEKGLGLVVKPEEKESVAGKFRLSRGIGGSGCESGFEFGGGGREGAACFPTYPDLW